MQKFTFQDICNQNQRRIHFYIHKLNIQDPHQEYYSEGLTALWQAYKSYDPDKGPMSSYFNFIIRNRLIDLLRKQNLEQLKREAYLEEYRVLHKTESVTLDEMLFEYKNPYENIKSHLTENQWKWFYFSIIQDMPNKAIAEQEDTTLEAVRGWAKLAKKKLRKPEIRTILLEEIR